MGKPPPPSLSPNLCRLLPEPAPETGASQSTTDGDILGAPSHAAEALELGYDAVLLNTAIAKAADPVAMAGAFRLAVEAGRAAYEAGLMEARDFASPSTPVIGTPFWHAVS